MALELHGSTGVSKVQDGVVGTAALAAGAATQEKRTAAAGEVLQTLVFTDAGSSTASGTLTNITGSAKPITPKSANSTILVEVSFHATVLAGGAGTNTTGGFRLFNYTSSLDIGVEASIGVVSGTGTNVQTAAMQHLAASIANTGLSALSFTLRARYTASACTVYGVSQVWKITEIQN